MKKYNCRAKFNGKGKVICCSQTKCVGCKDIDSCEELDFYIESEYQGIHGCMNERSYRRKNRRIVQNQ